MARFQIVTTDDQAHTEGEPSFAFQSLGHDSVRLTTYDHDGDYVVLRYEHGLELSIPEHRIKHIATTPAA
ncbi:hypothetical protein [Streptomyces leeuwenhoekii]|uniref:Sle1_107 protein n=1 Tax=Streptomyces leeuwenhoekii TaxID=1437453 RepID=A0A0F7VKK7_STRLW|nr:hypothetical protein [Streptomyces leeuwenhoekii]CQR59274.1 sle1_107 [Streptomyces leeuwenhoekii]